MLATTTPGVRLGRFLGAPVVLTWSWFLFVAAIVALYVARLRSLGESTTAAIAVAVALALVWGLSVLLHEFGHVLAARLLGCRVHRVELGFLGGETSVEANRADAREEFWVAAGGPMVSVGLGLPGLIGLLSGAGLSFGLTGRTGLVLASVGLANLAIAAFNLLPGLPLDGGRIALAGIWKVTGNPRTARRITAVIGQLIAVALVAAAVVIVLGQRTGLGASLPLIFALIILAGSLWSMAGRSRRSAELESRLADQPVTAQMTEADWVASDTPVETALAVTSRPVVLVHDPAAGMTGVIGRDRLVDVAGRGGARQPAGRFSAPLAPSQVLPEGASRLELLSRIGRTEHPWFAVVASDGLPLGIVAAPTPMDPARSSPLPTQDPPTGHPRIRHGHPPGGQPPTGPARHIPPTPR